MGDELTAADVLADEPLPPSADDLNDQDMTWGEEMMEEVRMQDALREFLEPIKMQTATVLTRTRVCDDGL